MDGLMAHQVKLAELGLYHGKLDGVLGPLTRWAILAFQRMFGLEPSGEVSRATRDVLNPAPIPERDEDPAEALPANAPAIWPRQAEVEKFFGRPGEHLTRLQLPFSMLLAWEKGTRIRSFLIHEKVHDSARRCFERIANSYDEAARTDLGINLFGGCYALRNMRGGSRLSMHSWGMAIDFDPASNQLTWGCDKARLAKPDAETFWRIWEEEGWVSLGRTRNYDFMHTQAARL